MPAPPPDPRPDRRPDPLVDRIIDAAIMVGLAVLILVGFATSYRTLRDLAATTGGYPTWLAPAVPLSFDLGIVVLSLKVARAAREGRTAPVMRLLVAALSATTVIANAAAATSPTARLLHAVPPAMFVVCFESVVISARRQALDRQGLLPQPLPRIRAVRWILAFPSTWAAWRTMVLTDPPSPGAPAGSPPVASPVPTPAPVPALAVPARPTDPPATPRSPNRDAHAAALLATHPALSSAHLARRLGEAGWPVSQRTAQRLRARLAPTATSTAAATRAPGPSRRRPSSRLRPERGHEADGVMA